jgi:hypothetical protein
MKVHYTLVAGTLALLGYSGVANAAAVNLGADNWNYPLVNVGDSGNITGLNQIYSSQGLSPRTTYVYDYVVLTLPAYSTLSLTFNLSPNTLDQYSYIVGYQNTNNYNQAEYDTNGYSYSYGYDQNSNYITPGPITGSAATSLDYSSISDTLVNASAASASVYALIEILKSTRQSALYSGTYSVTANVSPVPLPGALTLFGAGLIGLGGIAWGKARRKSA